MEKHIAFVRNSCYLDSRRISHVRQYLTQEAANKLACSFILSRIDYCNSLFSGLPNTHIAKLQQIRNNAARLVKKIRKHEHITPVLKELHWLPVIARIQYKIASLTYQCLNDPDFPSYITDLITPYVPTRPLRSSSKNTLQPPRTKFKTFGNRAFSTQAALVWNNLPDSIKNSPSLKSFKSVLDLSK